MTNIVPLNSQTHRTLRVHAQGGAAYGDDQRFVQVVAREFPLLAVHYPVLFSKDADTGAFYCGAMLGFDEGENLFLAGGKWQDTYRPLNLQRAPFYVAAGGDLGIDLDSPRIGAADGQRLFDDDGKPTPYLESVVAAFRELRPGIEQTKMFVDTLMGLKLIQPIAMDVAFDDGTRRDITGLYSIDEAALRALPDAAVLDLFRRNYLYLVYLMIASLKHVAVLAQTKNRRLTEPV